MKLHGLVWACVFLTLVFAQHAHAGASSNARLLSRLRAAAGGERSCQPWSVPKEQQCAYVRDNADICYPDGGFQEYLALHYCFFGATWGWLSLVLLLAVALLSFAVLLTVSERFFCPALELISDYLKLPPVVAGATLLSFGNGAPDTFTQVAAVAQDGGKAVGMALAEPLGGGMFASNVVFGMVVLIASKQQAVIQRWAFLKDVGFYLCSLVVVALMLADGKVTPVEAGTMLSLYVLYVAATFYTSRADEPLHADLALHEFPPEDGGIDVHDSSSEDFNWEESDVEHPDYVDATTSIREFDLEAPDSEVDLSLRSRANSLDSTDTPKAGTYSPAGSGVFGQPRRGSSTGPPGGGSNRTLQALLSWRHRSSNSGLREPLLLVIDESPDTSRDGLSRSAGEGGCDSNGASSSGDFLAGRHPVALHAGGKQDAAIMTADDAEIAAVAAAAAAEVAARRRGASRHQPLNPQQQQHQVTFEGTGLHPGADRQGSGSSTGTAVVSTSTPPSTVPQLPPPALSRGAGLLDMHGVPSLDARGMPAAPLQNPGSIGRRCLAAQGLYSFSADRSRRSPARASSVRGRSVSPAPDEQSDAAGLQGRSPRAASDSGVAAGYCHGCGGAGLRVLTPSYTFPSQAAGAAGDWPMLAKPPHSPLTPGRNTPGRVTPSGQSPHMQQLQEQHFAEQVELLEQQAAEHEALIAAHEDEEEVLKAGGTSFKHRLQQPLVQLLSFTMPRIGTGSGHRYGRERACLLPLTVPLLWFVADPDLLLAVGWLGLLFGCGCAAVGSCIIFATYPASSVPRKTLKGVFAVLAFVQAIAWLNLSASGLVQVCVVVGTIFGLKPALLGATVLAWGNSVPDLVNNVAMARDGFPSMAVAACFASPLFTLLFGMGGALAYGTALHDGPVSFAVDGPLIVMTGFSIASMVQHLIVVPLVHRFRMKPSMAVITFLFYACFNVVYVLATAGVIQIRSLVPARS